MAHPWFLIVLEPSRSKVRTSRRTSRKATNTKIIASLEFIWTPRVGIQTPIAARATQEATLGVVVVAVAEVEMVAPHTAPKKTAPNSKVLFGQVNRYVSHYYFAANDSTLAYLGEWCKD